MTGSPRLRLGVVIDGAGSHPAAWRLDDNPASLFTLGRLAGLVGRADRGGFDLAVIPDAFGLQPGGEGTVRGRLDAVLGAAAVAPLTSSIGLVPATDVTHTEPFHLSKNIATLDIVSAGRAGWWPQVSSTAQVADLFGRKDVDLAAELWAEAADAIEVVRRLWDSWEDGAVIRDVPTGRYIDRDKVHYIDFEGRFFSVRGPSITPRSPQGQPLVALAADESDAMAAVAAHADIALVSAPTPDAIGARRDEIRRRVAGAGRDPDDVTVLAIVDVLLGRDDRDAHSLRSRLDDLAQGPRDTWSGTISFVGGAGDFADLIAEWATRGVADGVLVRPVALSPTLGHLVDDVVPRLARLGLVDPPANGSLRRRFGLPRPPNRYALTAPGRHEVPR